MNKHTADDPTDSVDLASSEITKDTSAVSPSKPNFTRRLVRLICLFLFVLCGLFFAFWFYCIRMPGESFEASNDRQNESRAETPNLTLMEKTKTDSIEQVQANDEPTEIVEEAEAEQTTAVTTVADALKAHVVHLAETIGERNLTHYDELCEAADYIEDEFKSYGYETERQVFEVRGFDCYNIAAEIRGSEQPEKILIIGAHYDSVMGTPGANDNGSGTASMLVLANLFRDAKPKITLRFVAFTNEEPPYFQNRGLMGSWVYAEKCRKENQDIVGVLSLETMGYFTDAEDSQKYPAPLNLMYPSTGNFIGFVSNLNSRQFQNRVIKTFRENAKIPSEGASLPSATPGVGWSDHWSFWQEGYLGIMVTDTAPFRYPHYHEQSDTPDKIDYESLEKVIDGLKFVVLDLVGIEVIESSK